MSTSNEGGKPVDPLAEHLLDRERRGEPTTSGECGQQYLDWAGRIRVLFPARLMIKELRADLRAAAGGGDGRADSGHSPARSAPS
jgi:hypothetical protein